MESGAVLTDAQMWSLIVGFGLPLVIAVLQRPTFTGPIRTAISVTAALVAAVPTAYFAGDLTGKTWVSTALVITVTSISTYQMLWRQIKVAPWIEAKTSPDGAHVVTTVEAQPKAVEGPEKEVEEHPSPPV